MYLLILCVLFSWPVVIIFLFCFVATTYRWQGGCGSICLQGSDSCSHHMTEGT